MPTKTRRSSSVDEKIDRLEENVHTVLEGAKESIARAETSMRKAKEVLGEEAKTRSAEAYEKAKTYLAEAKRALDSARVKMGELYGRSREVVEELYEKARVQFDRLYAEVRKGYAKIKAKIQEIDFEEIGDEVVNFVRRNPGKAVLIAVAVGFAIGYMVRRREP
jgi:ElaB/YqjD/DUF883 family membrane-anchored ribosome-binding protein